MLLAGELTDCCAAAEAAATLPSQLMTLVDKWLRHPYDSASGIFVHTVIYHSALPFMWHLL